MLNKLTNLWSSTVDHLKVHLSCWNCLESLALGLVGVSLLVGCVGLKEGLGLVLVVHATKRLFHK